MHTHELRDILCQTLDDLRVSRGERRALREVFADAGLTPDQRQQVRRDAFDLAAGLLSDPDAKAVVEWLGDITAILERDAAAIDTGGAVAECHFSPGEGCRQRLLQLARSARRHIDACVFTITDNALARALADAHRRGVRVRVISDDDKAEDLGSDTHDLAQVGISVAFDRDPSHMHHKFAVFDRSLLATGSYNWTRSAFTENRENILVTDDKRLVAGFLGELDRLWAAFG